MTCSNSRSSAITGSISSTYSIIKAHFAHFFPG